MTSAVAGRDASSARAVDGDARLKRAAAERAVDFVRSGTVVGLGAGSTARFAVRRLAEWIAAARLRDIVGIPCSQEVAEEAVRLGIKLSTLNEEPVIDLTIDGADETDGDLNLIKGAGGALLHEKIVAQASRRLLIVVDASKPSARLGTHRSVPVEVVSFGWRAQASYLESIGARVHLRSGEGNVPFRTDEGHLILDCAFGPIARPHELAARLDTRAGIVEHGLFLGLATDVLIGAEGGVRQLSRKALGIR